MAKQDTFFDRIQRLFSTGVIVRNVGGKKLKVVDTDDIQQGYPERLWIDTKGYTLAKGA